jgi:hypothetical protein
MIKKYRIATVLECDKLTKQERFFLTYLIDLQGNDLHVNKYKIKIQMEKEKKSLIEKGIIAEEFLRIYIRNAVLIKMLSKS